MGARAYQEGDPQSHGGGVMGFDREGHLGRREKAAQRIDAKLKASIAEANNLAERRALKVIPLLTVSDGEPPAPGIYVVYVNDEFASRHAGRELLLWDEGAWWRI